jgi:large subunit ribosomal protein L21e
MQRIGGLRRKTRHLYTKKTRDKGKINITRYMQEFKKGDKIKILFDSSVARSPIKPRHYGKIGIVDKRRGECYEVRVKEEKKDKTIIIHPAHMEKLK